MNKDKDDLFLKQQRKEAAWGCKPTRNWEMMYEFLKQDGVLKNPKGDKIQSVFLDSKLGCKRLWHLINRGGEKIGVAVWPSDLANWFRGGEWTTIDGEKFDFPEPDPNANHFMLKP